MCNTDSQKIISKSIYDFNARIWLWRVERYFSVNG